MFSIHKFTYKNIVSIQLVPNIHLKLSSYDTAHVNLVKILVVE